MQILGGSLASNVATSGELFVDPQPATNGEGGAIYNAGVLGITGAILSQNNAIGRTDPDPGGEPAYGWGGGLYNSGQLSLTNTVIASNSAAGSQSIAALFNTGEVTVDSQSSVMGSPTGTPPLNFQWELNGSNIPFQATSMLTLTNVSYDTIGIYNLSISNSGGLVTNIEEIQNAPAPAALAFLVAPSGQAVWPGSTVELQGEAINVAASDYQWLFNGAALTGSTDASLVLTNVQPAEAGCYSVAVSNATSSATSAPVVLTVSEAVTSPAAQVSGSSASLLGNVLSNRAPGGAWFEWGLTTNYGNVTSAAAIGTGSQVLVSNQLVNLTPSSIYHYRLVATNSYGTGYGSDQAFLSVTAPQFVKGSISGNSGFSLQFTGTPSASYSVWDSGDLLTWTRAGTATEVSSGNYQFIDSTTNLPQRFYQVRAP